MKALEKYVDESGQETTRDKAVGRFVSIYDDDGNLVEERFGGLGDEKSLDSAAEAE